MTELQKLFFSRLNLEEQKTLEIEDLNIIMQAMAYEIPFENLDIVKGDTKEISKENLQEKILINSRGGLCYELNSIMYYFLKDCGFDAKLALGTVYDREAEIWALEEGHVTTILNYNHALYLIEVGLASVVPLVLVPFTGEVVKSINGEYRVRRKNTDKGSYVLERRDVNILPESDEKREWKLCHAFHTDTIDERTLNRVQKKVVEDENSRFNKGAIVVKLMDSGYISLTKESLTQTINGQKDKKLLTEQQYTEILQDKFNIKL
ncbi:MULTISPECIES: arylamine N-acetyltransferase family protein [Bacillus cereus group]|uniref:Arylamine N-acetyltransferase n=1 Tax=Bacillus cereus TaxID=1396 RepID=A0AA44Q6G7_BACCE|nr:MULTISPECIES: arylamine N-acetyltransferase [Bacillus cereus group]PFN03550.1 arylamine N-acetyltransferase [Bacillus cereus]PFO79866.1 arylamine N-acetyltransferase [Bacillus cereus]PFR90224.1 arylamine N-acetyltransferase [Bacillus cereus]